MTILTPRLSWICGYPNSQVGSMPLSGNTKSQVGVEVATTQAVTLGLCNPPRLYGNTKFG